MSGHYYAHDVGGHFFLVGSLVDVTVAFQLLYLTVVVVREVTVATIVMVSDKNGIVFSTLSTFAMESFALAQA